MGGRVGERTRSQAIREPMGGGAGGGAERQASRVPMGSWAQETSRPRGGAIGERDPEGGGGGELGWQPVKSTLGRTRSCSSPSESTPAPPGPASGPLARPRCFLFLRAVGVGRMAGTPASPALRQHAAPPQPPAPALVTSRRSAARSFFDSRVYRGFAAESIAFPRAFQLRISQSSGRPHVVRSWGTVDSSARACLCGSLPVVGRTTWCGTTRGRRRDLYGHCNVEGLADCIPAAVCANSISARGVLSPRSPVSTGEEPSLSPWAAGGQLPPALTGSEGRTTLSVQCSGWKSEVLLVGPSPVGHSVFVPT